MIFFSCSNVAELILNSKKRLKISLQIFTVSLFFFNNLPLFLKVSNGPFYYIIKMKFSWLLLNFLFAICVLFFCLRLIVVLQRAQLGSYVTQSIFVFSTCHTLPDWRLSYLLSWSNFMSCYDLPQNKRSLFANLNKAARRSQPSSLWYNVAGVLL